MRHGPAVDGHIPQEAEGEPEKTAADRAQERLVVHKTPTSQIPIFPSTTILAQMFYLIVNECRENADLAQRRQGAKKRMGSLAKLL
jgi:hypothetical protein